MEGICRHPVRALHEDTLTVHPEHELAGMRRVGYVGAVKCYLAQSDPVGSLVHALAVEKQFQRHIVEVGIAVPAWPPEHRPIDTDVGIPRCERHGYGFFEP